MLKDYYHILGINKNATSAEIKKAYRRLAKDVHPDVNDSPQASAFFHQLNEAYVILSDPKKRAQYDEDQESDQFTLSDEEIIEILRQRQASMRNDFRFESRNIYLPTDYKASEKTTTILNILMMCFALSLILDLFIYQPLGKVEVKHIKQKMLITGNLNDVDHFLLSTEKGVLEISALALRTLEKTPKIAELRKSLLYGNLSFRLSDDMEFIRNQRFVLVTYLFVVVVFIAGSAGLFPQMSAERKFNAAIVSTFFSLIILALLIIG